MNVKISEEEFKIHGKREAGFLKPNTGFWKDLIKFQKWFARGRLPCLKCLVGRNDTSGGRVKVGAKGRVVTEDDCRGEVTIDWKFGGKAEKIQKIKNSRMPSYANRKKNRMMYTKNCLKMRGKDYDCFTPFRSHEPLGFSLRYGMPWLENDDQLWEVRKTGATRGPGRGRGGTSPARPKTRLCEIGKKTHQSKVRKYITNVRE